MNSITVQFVKKSSNSKTGAIPITNSARYTCPKVCPFNNGQGCYADAGYYTKLNWNKVTSGERGADWDSLCDNVTKIKPDSIWRHNVSGDLPHTDEVIDRDRVEQLSTANTGKLGFTYTHHDMTIKANRDTIADANKAGFTINLSANNPAHADELAALDIGPVVTVCAGDQTENFKTPKGRKVVICPATQNDDISCETCKLCARQRDVIVAFPVHGVQASKIDI